MYSIRFGDGNAFALCSIGAWGQVKSWVQSVKGLAQEAKSLAALIASGESPNSELLANDVALALEMGPPPGVKGTLEMLAKNIGMGDAKETAAISDGANDPEEDGSVHESRDASGHEHAADGRFGSGGSAKSDPPATGDGILAKAHGAASSVFASIHQGIKSLLAKLDRHTDQAGVRQVKSVIGAGLSKIADAQRSLYATMEKRYGGKTAKSIFIAAQAVGGNPAVMPGWFVALPGATLLAQLPMMAIAEGILQTGRAVKGIGNVVKQLLSSEEQTPDIDALGQQVSDELHQAFVDWLEENRAEVEAALGKLPAGIEESQTAMESLADTLTAPDVQPVQPQPITVNVAPPAVTIHNTPPAVTIEPAQVTVQPANVQVDAPITVNMPKPTRKTIELDADGNPTAIVPEE